MNYKNLSDNELTSTIQKAVHDEKLAMTSVLHLLAEVDRRRLYSKTCPSLFEFCTRVLGYTNGSAQRRIDPTIEEKLVSGELNLSSVSKAQFFFRDEAKQGRVYSDESKKDLFQKLENKSSKEIEKIFVTISPQIVPQEKRRELTAELTELKVVLDSETVAMLEKIKALWSHKYPHLSDAALIKAMAGEVLQKIDPVNWKTRKAKTKTQTEQPPTASTTTAAANSQNIEGARVAHSSIKVSPNQFKQPHLASTRYNPRDLKKEVWIRYNGKCAIPGCNATHFLDYDHVIPLAFGGETTAQNMRLLCFVHHREASERYFKSWSLH